VPRTPELGHTPSVIFYSFSHDRVRHARLSHFRDSRYVEGTDQRSHDAIGPGAVLNLIKEWRSGGVLDLVYLVSVVPSER
jgi:hypothetical protein